MFSVTTIMADGEIRPLYLGIAVGNGLKWNEAKGRVKGGSLFVQVSIDSPLDQCKSSLLNNENDRQTPNGEQGMELTGSRVEFLELADPSSGPEVFKR